MSLDEQAEWSAALACGDYASAWAISDRVLSSRNPSTRNDPTRPYHLRWVWDGQPIARKHVLARCYHGLGDTIQFLRYVPALLDRSASLTVEIQPALLELAATVSGGGRFFPFDQADPLPPAECELEIMENAHALRAPPDIRRGPYLFLPASLRSTGAARGRLSIGLCWQAGDWDNERSITPAYIMEAASDLGASLVSLQEEDLPGLPETASTIAALDLVITVDTMIAHLAGALGVP